MHKNEHTFMYVKNVIIIFIESAVLDTYSFVPIFTRMYY